MAFWVMEQVSHSARGSRSSALFVGLGVLNGIHPNGEHGLTFVAGFRRQHVPNGGLWYGSIQQRAESSVQAFHTVMLDRLFHAVTWGTTA